MEQGPGKKTKMISYSGIHRRALPNRRDPTAEAGIKKSFQVFLHAKNLLLLRNIKSLSDSAGLFIFLCLRSQEEKNKKYV